MEPKSRPKCFFLVLISDPVPPPLKLPKFTANQYHLIIHLIYLLAFAAQNKFLSREDLHIGGNGGP